MTTSPKKGIPYMTENKDKQKLSLWSLLFFPITILYEEVLLRMPMLSVSLCPWVQHVAGHAYFTVAASHGSSLLSQASPSPGPKWQPRLSHSLTPLSAASPALPHSGSC